MRLVGGRLGEFAIEKERGLETAPLEPLGARHLPAKACPPSPANKSLGSRACKGGMRLPFVLLTRAIIFELQLEEGGAVRGESAARLNQGRQLPSFSWRSCRLVPSAPRSVRGHCSSHHNCMLGPAYRSIPLKRDMCCTTLAKFELHFRAQDQKLGKTLVYSNAIPDDCSSARADDAVFQSVFCHPHLTCARQQVQ